MRIKFWNSKNNKTPSLKSLHPPIFNVKTRWFLDLAVGIFIILVTSFIGISFLYTVYFESYKESDTPNDFSSLINVSRMQGVIEKRNDFLNAQVPSVPDPSF